MRDANRRVLTAVILGVGLFAITAAGVALVTASDESADGGDSGNAARVRSDERRTAGERAVAIQVFTGDGTRTLVAIPRIGRFGVRCNYGGRLAGIFRSTFPATLRVVAAVAGRAPVVAFVDPGKKMPLPASPTPVTSQTWHIAEVSKIGSTVTIVDIASSPAIVGSRGCVVSGYVSDR